MPSYCHDYMHCSQDRCPLKDKCYRYWLGKEIKNTDFQYASYYYPAPDEELGDKCEYYMDIKGW